MSLRVPKYTDDDFVPTKNIIVNHAVGTMDAFDLRDISPYNFSKPELGVLKKRFRTDLKTFNIYFLYAAIDKEFGYPEHLDNIGKQLLEYRRFNLFVAPRGFSKSTIISCGFPLHQTVFRLKEYIVIVSETMDISGDFVETIRNEVETNERIALFFGEFKSKKSEIDSTEKWTSSDIVCKSFVDGKPFYTRIRSRGLGQQIRGKKYRHNRPDLLIFDDMESRKNTDTEHQREKSKIWFNRDAIKIMDRFDPQTGKGQVIVAGTIVHPESRLNNLYKVTLEKLKNNKVATWIHQFYKAAADAKSLINPIWPERFPTEALREEREIAEDNQDLAGFYQEFFNEPVSEEDRKFKASYFLKRYSQVKIENYYGKLSIIHEQQRYPLTLSVGLDIGGFETQKSDYTSLVVLGNFYIPKENMNQGIVLEAFNERWNPDEIINAMFDISHRYKFMDDYADGSESLIPWTVETNAFQTLLYWFLNREMRRRQDFSVRIAFEDHESENKDGRIMSLLPVFKSGYYMWPEHLQWLCQRFQDYGVASDMHDDVEDAFQKAHRNLLALTSSDFVDLETNPKPYIHVVEPKRITGGNFITL